MNYKVITHISPIYYGPLLRMIHRAFASHLDNGLRFTCSFYTIDDLKHKILSGYCFMALSEDNTILGISSFSRVSSRGRSYENITCVSPEVRDSGIASSLYALGIEQLKQEGAKYVIADTAITAFDSITWHLQRCHCHKIGLQSFPSTNYYSYVFRRDIVSRSLFVTKFLYPISFYCSYCFTRLFMRRVRTDRTVVSKVNDMFRTFIKTMLCNVQKITITFSKSFFAIVGLING